MKGKFQGRNSVSIDAPAEKVWEVLIDSVLMPQWLSIVKEVTITSKNNDGGGEVRSCSVAFAGKAGTMVERCIERIPRQKISYMVDRDSFGFNKMFSDYGFSYILEEKPPRSTLCAIELYYTPKGLFSSMMNLVMKRKFNSTRQNILNSLKAFVEARSKYGNLPNSAS